ncbi:Hypothetical predicted protein, partial [Paramuricea clavata]
MAGRQREVQWTCNYSMPVNQHNKSIRKNDGMLILINDGMLILINMRITNQCEKR